MQEAILYHEKWVAPVLAWGTMPLSRFKSMLHVKQGEPSPLGVAVDALRLCAVQVMQAPASKQRDNAHAAARAALRALGVAEGKAQRDAEHKEASDV